MGSPQREGREVLSPWGLGGQVLACISPFLAGRFCVILGSGCRIAKKTQSGEVVAELEPHMQRVLGRVQEGEHFE